MDKPKHGKSEENNELKESNNSSLDENVTEWKKRKKKIKKEIPAQPDSSSKLLSPSFDEDAEYR